MCGISGIVRFGGSAAVDLADLDTMHRAQRHRGPDGEGAITIDRTFAVRRFDRVPTLADQGSCELNMIGAVRRLRISDLRAEADQPLPTGDGRYWTMLNGAIYNFRELAAELTAAGHRFHTGSDTEVVAEAFRRWGTSCFARFNGMWAILIIDLVNKRLVGSRDRIGIKPLYYAVDDQRLLFASEPSAIAGVQSAGAAAEPARLFEFLSGYSPRSNALSFFRGVQPIPAGSWFEIDLRGDCQIPQFQPFWDLSDFYVRSDRPVMTFAEAAEQYRTLLTSAVAGQSIADVKVGALLSGGLDSSTIVTLWAEIAKARGTPAPDTLSITWDDPDMSERPFIEAVAAKAQSNSHILELSRREIWRAVDDVVKVQGQPLLGQELIAQYHVYRLAHEERDVVVLDGNGSDEVQAGLPPYEAEMVIERLSKLQVFDVAKELRCIAHSYGRSYGAVIRSHLLRPLRRMLRERKGLPTYAWLDERACDTTDPDWVSGSSTDYGRDASRLNRILYREIRHTNVPTVLMYSDRNAMAHSVEARFPYLDHRLVEFCCSLPASYKVGFGRRKKLLFELAKSCLPRSVIERKDKKMFVRLTNWMPLRDEYATAIRDAARSSTLAEIPYVNAPNLHAFVDDYLAGRHDDAYAVWRIYTASRWLDLFQL